MSLFQQLLHYGGSEDHRKGLIYRMKGAFAASLAKLYRSGDSIVNAGWVEKKTTARMKVVDLTFIA
ncbi:MAG: hypothetical protein ACREQ7_00470 [Candidatus Binatia bacterium]